MPLFAVSGSLIGLSGRLFLSLQIIHVRYGQNRKKTQVKQILGKLHLFLSADVLHPSTSNRHINNLAKILTRELGGRKHLVLLADNGPDWAMCYANIMSFGRLWRKLKLERLTIIHYCPNHSRFNFIERRWGRCSLYCSTSPAKRPCMV